MCVKETAGIASHGESRTAEAPKTRKMSFVSDRLYNGYLRTKMSTFATKVKVREIMTHLPCLTLHDRENIEAKRETNGNFDSMVMLLDCLKRRESWPQQFIDALEACEHTTLAAEMRAEYDALRGANNSSSPPATVVRAHVHPAPPAGPPSAPVGGAKSQVAAAAASPPEPAPQAQLPEAVSPPEPVSEPAQATEVEEAARPSAPAAATPPQREVNAPQEPEENSESDIQDVPGDNGVTPDPQSVENGEVSMGRCEAETPSHPDPLQTTTTSAEVGPPPMDSDVTDGSSSLAVTPERPPVQDTAAHVDLKAAVVLQPAESFEPAATQVVESNPGTEVAAATPPLPGANGRDAALHGDDDVCLSKPGQLVSIHPPNNARPTGSGPAPPAQPYSGDSGRLEFSNPPTEPSAAAPPPAGAAAPCRENGVPVRRNEPEEDHYESRSSEGPQVMTHVVHVSQGASILNLDGQSPAPARVGNGEAAEGVTSAPFACTGVKSPSGPDGISPQLKTPQDSEKKTAAHAKYVVTAAGVAACALLLAWRFKN
ncbi:mitochondrial antiviral-signaling protein [Pungitius pungitius]|uniref:mitochondrial antiviral-signaling protein n=1 Tax=Pungitius pungitius TaxID=134920 RepID=UPI002E0D1F8B